MKVFHQDRARKKLAVGVLAASMLASVFAVAPAAHAQPNWLEVEECDAEDLVEAVELANALPAVDTIVLDDDCEYEFEKPYFDDDAPPPPVFTENALPVITDDLTIVGDGAKVVGEDDDEGWSFRFMEIDGVDVTIRDLTIEGFELAIPPAGPGVFPAGGAILNNGGDLLLVNVTLKDNEVFVLDAGFAATSGGAIASNGGSVTLRNSTVKGNEVGLVNLGGIGLAAAGGIAVDGGAGPCPAADPDPAVECGLELASSSVKGNKVAAVGLAAITVAFGGGVAVVDGARLVSTNSSVSSNTASAKASNSGFNVALAEAGGVYLGDTGNADGHVMTSTKVDGNRAKAEGGALAAAIGGGVINVDEDGPDTGDPGANADGLVMNGGSISKNKAACDDVCIALGGGYANASALGGGTGEATFNGTVFKGNVADGDDGIALGGGLFLAGDGDPDPETVLNEATVTKNIAKGDAFEAGGGIFVEDAEDVDVDDSEISKNKPDNCATLDGPIYCGDDD